MSQDNPLILQDHFRYVICFECGANCSLVWNDKSKQFYTVCFTCKVYVSIENVRTLYLQ